MLLDHVATTLDAEGVGELLTMAGFELEGVEGDVLDIKVTSNRGDGLSVVGLAREVLAKDPASRPTALYERAVAGFSDVPLGDAEAPGVTVESERCRRLTAVRIESVRAQDSPKWLVERLEAAGMRSLGLLVDLTNYVMLELGAPTHTFDADRLTGGRLVIREAREDESIKTLDGGEHRQIAGLTMVCDAERPQSVAGIMGGAESETTDSTTAVLLEAGNWEPIPIRRTRVRLGLGTEASYRFERDADPLGTLPAIRRYVELLRAEQPAIRVSAPADVARPPREIPPIVLRMSRTVARLGMPVSAEEARGYLTRLGMAVWGDGEPFTVAPPTWRPDLRREDDLVEEIGRVHGYEKIPEAAPVGSVSGGGRLGPYLREARLREAALRAGFDETVSHSLRDLSPLDAGADRVRPRVAPGPETSVLRDSLLPGLADAAVRNGGRDLHLFEMGRVFRPDEERTALALLSVGRLSGEFRKGDPSSSADFLSLKGTVEGLLGEVSGPAEFRRPSTPDARLHPGRQAEIVSGDAVVGRLGELHPEVTRALGLSGEVVVAELFPAALAAVEPDYRPVSRQPGTRRDLAVLAPRSLLFSEIRRVVEWAVGPELENLGVFDVYEGAGIPEGHRSIGIALTLRKAAATFTDEEANGVRELVAAALVAAGATIR